MGLFGDIVKSITRGVVNQEVNKVERNIVNKVEDTFGNDIKSMKKEESKYSIPEEYMHFPQFDGVIENLSTKNEDKYKRCTIDYKGTTSEEINKYRDAVEKAGYKKMTNVRYEKGNEYIIIEEDYSLHLVFHIKK